MRLAAPGSLTGEIARMLEIERQNREPADGRLAHTDQRVGGFGWCRIRTQRTAAQPAACCAAPAAPSARPSRTAEHSSAAERLLSRPLRQVTAAQRRAGAPRLPHQLRRPRPGGCAQPAAAPAPAAAAAAVLRRHRRRSRHRQCGDRTVRLVGDEHAALAAGQRWSTSRERRSQALDATQRASSRSCRARRRSGRCRPARRAGRRPDRAGATHGSHRGPA